MIQLVAQKTGGSIRQVCAVLGEARSSFYHAATPTPRQVADADLGDLIEAVFRRHRRGGGGDKRGKVDGRARRYGYRRLAEELSDRGVTCAAARAERSETAAHSFLQIKQRQSVASRPSEAGTPLRRRPSSPKPATAEPTSPRPICSPASLCRPFLTAPGPGTLPSSRPATDGSTSPSSSISAPAFTASRSSTITVASCPWRGFTRASRCWRIWISSPAPSPPAACH